MNPYLSDLLEPHHFSKSVGIHDYIELFPSEGSIKSTQSTECTIGTLSESEIDSWLHQPQQAPSIDKRSTQGSIPWRLRVLFSPARRDPGLSIEPYYFRQSTYDSIVNAFGIEQAFLALVSSYTPLHTSFEVGDGAYGILANIASHGLALRHDPKTRLTVCYVVGLCEHQIQRCQAELQSLSDHGQSPMLFPAIWLDVFIETRVRRAMARTDTICHIQQMTGLHWCVNNAEAGTRDIDFEELTYALTVLGNELAWDEFAITTLEKIQENNLVQHRHISDTSVSSVIRSVDQTGLTYSDIVGTRLLQSKDILYGLKGKTRYNAKQVAIQREAIYNLISQRDNKLAMETAADIRTIAGSLQADNAVMRDIAEDSREVACLSRRDGTDMRVIALVTLLFLPATFTATLFSTSFFDFASKSSRTESAAVSRWIWIYCLLTLVLTALVVGIWRFIVYRKKDQYQSSRARQVVEIEEITVEKNHMLQSEACPATLAEQESCLRKERDIAIRPLGPKSIERDPQKQVLPASKVVFKGADDDNTTCACCACRI